MLSVGIIIIITMHDIEYSIINIFMRFNIKIRTEQLIVVRNEIAIADMRRLCILSISTAKKYSKVISEQALTLCFYENF
ncbi:hypothetical protein C5470_19445 [Photorhabdus stackebrandtii]|uniref:Uncharacterized protein n=1 Tax=Photorhabdus stackebrandtii TaxID=1123042 RepID=A0A7X5QPX3_9GAMM|nr:hypothetical protein [Photorhabdus stackebrandtii]